MAYDFHFKLAQVQDLEQEWNQEDQKWNFKDGWTDKRPPDEMHEGI